MVGGLSRVQHKSRSDHQSKKSNNAEIIMSFTNILKQCKYELSADLSTPNNLDQSVNKFKDCIVTHIIDMTENLLKDFFANLLNLYKSLTPTLCTDTNKEILDDTLIGILLTIDLTQPMLLKLMVNQLKKLHYASYHHLFNMLEDPPNLVIMMLNEIRKISHIVEEKKFLEGLMGVLPDLEMDLQKEIIICLPELIFDEAHCEYVCLELVNLFKTTVDNFEKDKHLLSIKAAQIIQLLESFLSTLFILNPSSKPTSTIESNCNNNSLILEVQNTLLKIMDSTQGYNTTCILGFILRQLGATAKYFPNFNYKHELNNNNKDILYIFCETIKTKCLKCSLFNWDLEWKELDRDTWDKSILEVSSSLKALINSDQAIAYTFKHILSQTFQNGNATVFDMILLIVIADRQNSSSKNCQILDPMNKHPSNLLFALSTNESNNATITNNNSDNFVFSLDFWPKFVEKYQILVEKYFDALDYAMQTFYQDSTIPPNPKIQEKSGNKNSPKNLKLALKKNYKNKNSNLKITESGICENGCDANKLYKDLAKRFYQTIFESYEMPIVLKEKIYTTLIGRLSDQGRGENNNKELTLEILTCYIQQASDADHLLTQSNGNLTTLLNKLIKYGTQNKTIQKLETTAHLLTHLAKLIQGNTNYTKTKLREFYNTNNVCQCLTAYAGKIIKSNNFQSMHNITYFLLAVLGDQLKHGMVIDDNVNEKGKNNEILDLETYIIFIYTITGTFLGERMSKSMDNNAFTEISHALTHKSVDSGSKHNSNLSICNLIALTQFLWTFTSTISSDISTKQAFKIRKNILTRVFLHIFQYFRSKHLLSTVGSDVSTQQYLSTKYAIETNYVLKEDLIEGHTDLQNFSLTADSWNYLQTSDISEMCSDKTVVEDSLQTTFPYAFSILPSSYDDTTDSVDGNDQINCNGHNALINNNYNKTNIDNSDKLFREALKSTIILKLLWKILYMVFQNKFESINNHKITNYSKDREVQKELLVKSLAEIYNLLLMPLTNMPFNIEKSDGSNISYDIAKEHAIRLQIALLWLKELLNGFSKILPVRPALSNILHQRIAHVLAIESDLNDLLTKYPAIKLISFCEISTLSSNIKLNMHQNGPYRLLANDKATKTKTKSQINSNIKTDNVGNSKKTKKANKKLKSPKDPSNPAEPSIFDMDAEDGIFTTSVRDTDDKAKSEEANLRIVHIQQIRKTLPPLENSVFYLLMKEYPKDVSFDNLEFLIHELTRKLELVYPSINPLLSTSSPHSNPNAFDQNSFLSMSEYDSELHGLQHAFDEILIEALPFLNYNLRALITAAGDTREEIYNISRAYHLALQIAKILGVFFKNVLPHQNYACLFSSFNRIANTKNGSSNAIVYTLMFGNLEINTTCDSSSRSLNKIIWGFEFNQNVEDDEEIYIKSIISYFQTIISASQSFVLSERVITLLADIYQSIAPLDNEAHDKMYTSAIFSMCQTLLISKYEDIQSGPVPSFSKKTTSSTKIAKTLITTENLKFYYPFNLKSQFETSLHKILKLLFIFCKHPIDLLDDLSTNKIKDLVEYLSGDAGKLLTYPTFNRSFFPIYFECLMRELCTITKAIDKNIHNPQNESLLIVDLENLEEHAHYIRYELIKRANIIVRIFHILVNIIKIFDNKAILITTLKLGKNFIESFYLKTLPKLEEYGAFINNNNNNNNNVDMNADNNNGTIGLATEIQGIFKNLQKSTRYLHSVCGHCKNSKDIALMKHVPPLKKVLETFLYKVKGVLTKHSCGDNFWLGNLKHRDLQGVYISSQIQITQEPLI